MRGYLDGGVSGEDPEHHGDPVEPHHQEHPVRVHRRVQDQNQHPESIVEGHVGGWIPGLFFGSRNPKRWHIENKFCGAGAKGAGIILWSQSRNFGSSSTAPEPNSVYWWFF